jgi:ankyrin repeat protein
MQNHPMIVRSLFVAAAIGIVAAPAPAQDGAENVKQKPASGEFRRDQVPGLKPAQAPAAPGAPTPNLVQVPGTAPAAAGPVDNRPAIKFEPAVLDHGDMQAEVAKTGTITVVNILDKPIKITKITPGCGCTTTGAPPGEIAPGASANVDITLKPGSKAGAPISKMVTFSVEGHAPQMLTVKGLVKAYVKLSREMVDAPSDAGAPPTPITLSAADGVAFKVTGASPDVLVALPTESKLEHEVQVDWKKWEQAGSSVKIALTTDNPKAPQLTLLVKRPIKGGEAGNRPVPSPAATAPAIVLAARSGDAAALKGAIASGTGVDTEEPVSRRTSLHFAAEAGNVEMVNLLLESKANPNAKDRTGKTPITLAAERGKAEALAALVKGGGNVNERDQVQGSPLLWASGLGTPDTVKILLDAGADPNVFDVNGMTPLMWAAAVGKPESVTLLMTKGAKADAVDRLSGENALMRAIRTGKIDTVRIFLAAKPDLATKNTLGMTPFLIACAYGDVDKIKLLMDAGCDKAAKDTRGWGAIDHARNRVDARREEVVKYLEPLVPASTAAAPPQVPGAAK